MNTPPQWTPGPWRTHAGLIRSDAGAIALLPNGQGIVKPATTDADEMAANARLIASAPDMAAEVERLRAQAAQLQGALVNIADATYGTDTPKLRERARSALAQAGGAV